MGRRPKITLGIAGVLAAVFVSAFGILYAADAGEYPVAKSVAQDPTIPHVEIYGVTLHAEACGDPDSPVVVALHNGPLHPEDAAEHQARLAPRSPPRGLAPPGLRNQRFNHCPLGLGQGHANLGRGHGTCGVRSLSPALPKNLEGSSGLTEIAVRPGSVSERDGFAWTDLVAEADSVEAQSA